MVGVDTNVLVRFLVRDDEAQFEKARRLLEREAGEGEAIFIGLMVLLEAEWVLRSRYRLVKTSIVEAMSALLAVTGIRFEDEASVEEAVFFWKKSNANFADCLIGAHNRRSGCRSTATFDVKAGSLPDFVLL